MPKKQNPRKQNSYELDQIDEAYRNLSGKKAKKKKSSGNHRLVTIIIILVAILLVAVFSFQLNQTETAVVTTFGKPAQVTEPGLHFRWPFPFQKIYRFDKRVRSFEGGAGKLEETTTSSSASTSISKSATSKSSSSPLRISPTPKISSTAGCAVPKTPRSVSTASTRSSTPIPPR